MIYILLLLLLLLLLLFIFTYINRNSHKKNNYTSYTAIIIEPREHKALSYVLQNFLKNLSNDWNIIIMHGNKNIDFINNIINKDLNNYKDRITLINLNVDNLTIEEYNKLLTSRKFYKNIPSEVFLIFQTDTIICDENKDLINNFIKYDYVGAPWIDYTGNGVGNGGLSLRRKSKMLEILSKYKRYDENEDMFFSNAKINNYNIPKVEEAKYFSVESVYNKDSFGIHKPWLYLNENELKNKITNCNSLKKLLELS